MSARQAVHYDVQLARKVSGHYADVVGVGPKQKLSCMPVEPGQHPPLVMKCELNRMHVQMPPPGQYFQ